MESGCWLGSAQPFELFLGQLQEPGRRLESEDVDMLELKQVVVGLEPLVAGCAL